MDPKSESGAQLFSRLTSKLRPSLMNLSAEIIPNNGPKSREIIEISGDSNTGKTLHLMELIARTIIPNNFGGKGAQAIVIDTNSNFHVPNILPKIIEKHILHHQMMSTKETDTEVLHAATENVEALVLSTMKKITFFKCYNSNDYELILNNCVDILTASTQVSLIAIDSIATFYWADMSERGKPIRMETYLRFSLKKLRKLCDEYSVLFVYTRPSDFGTISLSQDKEIDCKIQLNNNSGSKDLREARCYYDYQTTSRCYAINDFGIQWISSNDNN